MTKKQMMVYALVAVLSVFGSGIAADALTLSSVEGDWGSTTGGQYVNYNDDVAVGYGNGQEDQVRWGKGVVQANKQSGLGFTGSASGSEFGIGEAFEIGQLRHFNNPIYLDSIATGVELSLSLAFSDPAGLAEIFDFDFTIDETPNAPGPPVSDDFIDFYFASAPQTFTIEGVDYTLELLGFGDSPSEIIEQFRSPEGGTNSTLLWGRITTPNTNVPEPGTMLLLGFGLLGLATFKKTRG